MKRIAVYPGSFDPVTYGHLDIIRRAERLADEVVVCVLENRAKTPLFSVDERVNMLREVTADMAAVRVERFHGMTIDFARAQHASMLVRGLRAVTDFEYELQIAQTNKILEPSIETVFLTTSLNYSYLSSSTTKEVAAYDGDISAFVPPSIAVRVREKIKEMRNEQN